MTTRSLLLRVFLGVVAAGFTPIGLAAQDASPGPWIEDLFPVAAIGGIVEDFAIFDDGTGPAIFAAGSFSAAGFVVANIAKWNGSDWESLDGGTNGRVAALSVFDDGAGPALYAGGDFTEAGGVSVGHVARWDGTSWSALGAGVDGGVRAFAAFDDGSGSALYVGGHFLDASGVPANRVARWDGAAWSALASGLNEGVAAMAVYDDGAGEALFVGGFFNQAGGAPAARIARWDGAAWSPVGSGADDFVLSFLVTDLGAGPVLVAGGAFERAGGVACERIATWDGAAWARLGGGWTRGTVEHIARLGDDLFAVGTNLPYGGWVTRLVGDEWTDMGGRFEGGVHAAIVADDGSAPRLHVANDSRYGNTSVQSQFGRFVGDVWTPYPSRGIGNDDRGVGSGSPIVFDDGSGAALYYVGSFDQVGDIRADGMARFDGCEWEAVEASAPPGFEPSFFYSPVLTFDDGTGPAIYAIAHLTPIGGISGDYVARFDGNDWSTVGPSFGDAISSLAVFDDGGGPALYASGPFVTVGGAPAKGVARWSGAAWSEVGGGVELSSGGGYVGALCVHDDGAGDALHAGGRFDLAGGVACASLAKWDGTAWSSVGGVTREGQLGSVSRLHSVSGPSGRVLYLAGLFDSAGAVAASRIASWKDDAFAPLGGGFGFSDELSQLVSVPTAAGHDLYVAGTFQVAGGVDAANVARWDGASWWPLGSGVDDSARRLVVFDDGTGPVLYVSGAFFTAGGSAAGLLAAWALGPSCGAGNVNAASGPIADVLFANGAAGAGWRRELEVGASAPFSLSMAAPPSAPAGPAGFAAYAWTGRPTCRTRRVLRHGIGVACMPMPLSDANPAHLKVVWNNLGFQSRLGTPTMPSTPAPSVLLDRPAGVGRSLSFFVQGLIADTAAPNGRVAVTNGIAITAR